MKGDTSQIFPGFNNFLINYITSVYICIIFRTQSNNGKCLVSVEVSILFPYNGAFQEIFSRTERHAVPKQKSKTHSWGHRLKIRDEGRRKSFLEWFQRRKCNKKTIVGILFLRFPVSIKRKIELFCDFTSKVGMGWKVDPHNNIMNLDHSNTLHPISHEKNFCFCSCIFSEETYLTPQERPLPESRKASG